jgi:hypothetical protein
MIGRVICAKTASHRTDGRSIADSPSRRDVLVWPFTEYFVLEAIDDFHELVNVTLLARDTPKLEDPAAHFVPKTRAQGCCDHLIKPLCVEFIEDGRALRQTGRRRGSAVFGMEEGAFGAAVLFAEDTSSQSASNVFQSAWSVPSGIRNENPITGTGDISL